ncbi:MAG: tetratricopeptide repeat protein [Acidobacteriia bacterium]|nr:tetratricopeptide repeat protein [Terriglobia bacterium]
MDRIAALKELLAENPTDAFARYGLAMEYSKAGDVAGALDEFNTILRHNPDYVPAYQMAGQMLVNAGRIEEARKLFESGIASARRSGNQHAASEMQGMLDVLPL